MVQGKLESISRQKNGPLLTGTYQTLKKDLERYPPNPEAFSEPIYFDQDGYYWVRSQNKQITVRAKYFAAQEICIIDHVWLARETPEDLSLEQGDA